MFYLFALVQLHYPKGSYYFWDNSVYVHLGLLTGKLRNLRAQLQSQEQPVSNQSVVYFIFHIDFKTALEQLNIYGS